MLNIFRKKNNSTAEAPGLFQRLSQGLTKTRAKFGEQLSTLFLGKKQIDAALLEQLEHLLLTADLGVQTSHKILESLTQKVERQQLNNSEALFEALKISLLDLLLPCETSFASDSLLGPRVILLVGINGAGKTTTIGKLAHHFKKAGNTVMLAAGDTFRAAAVEQLQAWGTRSSIPVIAQGTGADSASVLYDAVQAAKAQKIDLLLADTAGRLHTKSNLMEELKKIKRVLAKADASAPHEVLLVLDASIGQNALNQAREFHEAVGVTGLVITKLDGSAKGGMLFAIADQLKLPIAFIGVGEGVEDLQRFDAEAFIEALFEG